MALSLKTDDKRKSFCCKNGWTLVSAASVLMHPPPCEDNGLSDMESSSLNSQKLVYFTLKMYQVKKIRTLQ